MVLRKNTVVHCVLSTYLATNTLKFVDLPLSERAKIEVERSQRRQNIITYNTIFICENMASWLTELAAPRTQFSENKNIYNFATFSASSGFSLVSRHDLCGTVTAS